MHLGCVGPQLNYCAAGDNDALVPLKYLVSSGFIPNINNHKDDVQAVMYELCDYIIQFQEKYGTVSCKWVSPFDFVQLIFSILFRSLLYCN